MNKHDAQAIAKRLQEELKPLTGIYFAEEKNGTWLVGRKPNYGCQEYIDKNTYTWSNEVNLIYYLIGYAAG